MGNKVATKALFLVLLMSYSLILQSQNACEIEGYVSDKFNGGKAVIYPASAQNSISASIKDGHFKMETNEFLNDLSFLSIEKDSFEMGSPIILEKGRIFIKMDSMIRVSGTYLNNEFQQYTDSCNYYFDLQKNHKTNKFASNDYCLFIKKFGIRNKYNMLGYIVLRRELSIFPHDIYKETKKLFSDMMDTDNKYNELFKSQDEHRLLLEKREELIGKPCPIFVLNNENGDENNITTFIGKSDFLYINFWASWCSVCIYKIPSLNEIHKKYKERGLTIINISIDEDQASWKGALNKHSMEFGQYICPPGFYSKLRNLLAIDRIPYGILIDRRGIIIDAEEDETHISNIIRKLYPVDND